MASAYGTRSYGESGAQSTADGIDVIQVGLGGQDIIEYTPINPVVTGGITVIAPVVIGLAYRPRTPLIDIGTVHDATPTVRYNESLTINDVEFDRALYPTFTGNQSLTIISEGDNAVVVEKSYKWWNHNWPYRRILNITPPPSGLEKNHPITTYITRDITKQGKTRDDIADIRVAYLASETPELWKVLPASVEALDTAYRIRFNLPEAITESATPSGDGSVQGVHYVYYGNKGLREDPIVAAYSYEEYPLEVEWNEGGITYTNPGVDWSDNISQVRGAKANFTFYGEQLRLYATTGRSWGEMLVTITNTSADQTFAPGTKQLISATPTDVFTAIVDLYNDDEDGENLVFTVTGLPDGIHHLRIEDIGSSNPLSDDVKINVTKVAYKKHAIAEDIGEEADRTMKWSAGTGGSV